jgi:hypothetical protein
MVMSDKSTEYLLTHPVYLDVAMMISFLAYLDGGVVTQEEATQKETGSRDRIFKGRAGIRAKLPWALDAEAGTEASNQRRDEMSLESKSARQHTAASLFNSLYEYLTSDGQVTALSDSSQLKGMQTGQLVEFSGEYLGNPLEDFLAYVKTIYGYVVEQQQAELKAASDAAEKARKSQKSGNPSVRAQAAAAPASTDLLAAAVEQVSAGEFGVKIMLRMVDDISQVPVHDLLFQMPSGLQAVLTASSEYYSPEINEYLRAGEFRVIGKVTRIVADDSSINLTRRTVLGVASPEIAQNLVSSARTTEGMKIDVADPIVKGPAVQVLPMAIFI